MNKDTRLVRDADFYKLSAIMLSDKFLEKESQLLDRLKKLGCPIPQERFKTAKEYYSWVGLYKDKIKDVLNADNTDSLFESLLIDFNLDSKNEKYLQRLKWKFYFNKDEGPVIPVNSPKTKWENGQLWVLLPDWTKQEYYESWWDSIAFQLDKYPNRKKKDKERTSFERNFLLYQLHEKKMAEKKNGNWKGSIEDIFFNLPEFKEICNPKRGKIDSSRELKKIVTYFNNLLKDIPIMDIDKQSA